MTREEKIELRAGVLLGQLQNEGFSPADVTAILQILSAYMIENQSKNPRKALEVFISTITNMVNDGLSVH